MAASITGGQYAVSTDGGATWSPWTSSEGMVNPGNMIKVSQLSSAIPATTTTATLTIGGVSAGFQVTTTATPVLSVLPTNGLISLWRAEFNPLDSFGGNHGIMQGGGSYASGRLGQAFSFDGTDDYVDAGTSDVFNFNNGSGDFTIQSWIKLDSMPAFGSAILGKATHGPSGIFGGPYSGWAFYLYNDGRLAFGGAGVWEFTSSAGTLAPGAWYHVAVTRNGGVYRLYSNGQEVASKEFGNLQTSATALRIGSTYTDALFFDGLIDEVAIYSRALSSAEIQGYYQSSAPIVTLPFRDEFNVARSGSWKITNPDPDSASLVATPGNLRLATTSTDLWGGSNNIKNLYTVQLPDGSDNYRVTTRFSLPAVPTALAQQAGILLMADTSGEPDMNNYLRIMYAFENNTRRVELAYEENGAPHVVNTTTAVELAPDQPVWLRIEKAGTSYTLQYSLDGQSYFTFHTMTGNWAMAHAGLFAINGEFAVPSIQADFDFFEVAPVPPTPSPCAAMPSSLVSWWTGDGSAKDLAAANNGFLQGNVQFVGGMVGQAIAFDGVGDHIEVGNTTSLNLSGGHSVSLWVKLDAYPAEGANAVVMNKWVNGSEDKGLIITSDGKVAYLLYPAMATPLLSNNSITPGVWTHIAATFDGSTATLSFNGSPDAFTSHSGAVANGTGKLFFGHNPDRAEPGLVPFSGLMDEIQWHDRAMTANEIRNQFRVGATGVCKGGLVPLAGQVAWWRGDGSAADSTSGHNGSFVGVASYGDGILGKAFNLDGTNHVGIPAFDMGNSWTVEGWLKPVDSSDHVHHNFFSRSNGNMDGMTINHLSSAHSLQQQIGMSMGNGGSWESGLFSGTAYPENNWYHVNISRIGSLNTLHVDGIYKNQENVNVSGIYQTRDITLGYWNYGIPASLVGAIDEVRIYNRQLSSDELSLRVSQKPDTTPEAFPFTSQAGLPVSTPVVSGPITVTAINAPAAIVISGGEYQLNGSGAWTSTASMVISSDTVRVRLNSSASYSTTTTATLTIGGVSGTFSVTTAPDITLNVISPTNLISQTINGTVKAGASVTVSLGGASPQAATVVGTDWSFIVTGLARGDNSIAVSASDSGGYVAAKSATITCTAPRLTVSVSGATGLSGNGGGTVTSNPAGITCASGACASLFDGLAGVILTAEPDINSLIGSWGGACSGYGNGASCSLVMAADMAGDASAAATFTYVEPARIEATGLDYPHISAAYTAMSVDGTILARQFQFDGGLSLDLGWAVILKGGHNAAYSENSGYSTIAGALTLKTGRLTVERVIIR
jgi:hypothetical protein